jgi:DNA-binding XRE family transcriptional regulator
MQRSNVLVRLFRALSEKSQPIFAAEVGVHPGTMVAYEAGRYEPSPEHLEEMARVTGYTVAQGIEILQFCQDLRKPRTLQGQGAEDLFAEAGELFSNRARIAYQRMLRARLLAGVPDEDDKLPLVTRPEGPA